MSTTGAFRTLDENDPRLQEALSELRDLISCQFPTTTYTVTHGEDPDGIYLTATVDVDDLADVMDVFISRLTDLQVDKELPVYVVLEQPLDRVMAQVRAKANGTRQLEDATPEFLTALGLSDADQSLV